MVLRNSLAQEIQDAWSLIKSAFQSQSRFIFRIIFTRRQTFDFLQERQLSLSSSQETHRRSWRWISDVRLDMAVNWNRWLKILLTPDRTWDEFWLRRHDTSSAQRSKNLNLVKLLPFLPSSAVFLAQTQTGDDDKDSRRDDTSTKTHYFTLVFF